MPDRYMTFAELAAHERDGIDYRIRAGKIDERVAVVAPHGGYIEPGTSQLTGSIAGGGWSFYRFEGLRPGRPHDDLHIASERFDEPIGRAVVASCELAIGVHGRSDRGDGATVWLGGRAFALRDAAVTALIDAGFRATADQGELRGESPDNICNRCRSGAGIQLEVPRSLRDRLLADELLMSVFAAAVQPRGRAGRHAGERQRDAGAGRIVQELGDRAALARGELGGERAGEQPVGRHSLLRPLTGDGRPCEPQGEPARGRPA